MRSRFGSAVLMRASFHTPSSPLVPVTSPSLVQDALDTPQPCRAAPIKCSKGRAAPLGMPHTTSFLTWALLAASDSWTSSALQTWRTFSPPCPRLIGLKSLPATSPGHKKRVKAPSGCREVLLRAVQAAWQLRILLYEAGGQCGEVL